MKKEYISFYSSWLHRNMGVLIYGEDSAKPLLMFPTQDSLCGNPEDFGMMDAISDFIDGGKVQVFTVDTVDRESWSAEGADNAMRTRRQEEYYHFICDEIVPFIGRRNTSGKLPAVTGFSMGGGHAAIVFLRRPELFSGMLAISGVYQASYFFGNWMDSTLYDNSPVDFMRNMPPDHPYVSIYNQKRIVFCVGQGAWEDEGIRTAKILEKLFALKGIHGWFDFWGYDVNHDWPWWKKMIRYHLPGFLQEEKT